MLLTIVLKTDECISYYVLPCFYVIVQRSDLPIFCTAIYLYCDLLRSRVLMLPNIALNIIYFICLLKTVFKSRRISVYLMLKAQKFTDYVLRLLHFTIIYIF